AKVVGLDIAGIDVISQDITVSMRENGAGICEVNAAPGFRMHSHPTIGEPQFVAKPVIDMLFPNGAPSRIPITAITGTNGKTTTGRMLSHILKGVGIRVGMTSTSGIVIDEQIVIKADASGPKSARMVLQNPSVEHAVFEVARGGLLREGLGYQRNDVAVVTNVASDHLGRGGIDTVEELASVKQVIVEAVPRDGFAVLNADDELVADMRNVCDGELVFFSMHPDNEHVIRHARRGGRVVVVEKRELGDMIVFKHGRRTMDLVYTHLLPSTFGGRAIMNVYNAMAAAGAAIVSGVHLHDVRHGLRSFNTSFAAAPGRLNVLEVEGFHAIVDYCHNPHGMRMVGDFVERIMADRPEQERGERICVAAVPGDRRDEDIREFGQEAARFFDRIIVREDVGKRGREPGESAALLVEGVRAGMAQGARAVDVSIELDELAASRDAMNSAKRHDVVVFCADDIDGTWNVVQRFRAEHIGHVTDTL
ncbi:MAG: cyanophycin synthetase, partial [Glaciecola sp.]